MLAIYRRSARGIAAPPPAMNRQATLDCVLLAKTGTEEERAGAVEALILGHIRLAGSIAAKFAGAVPLKADDIAAFAFYQLVEITNRIALNELMTEHNEYDAYLSYCLNREIQRYLNQDHVVKPPTNDPKVLEREIRKDPEGFALKYTPKPINDGDIVTLGADRNFDLFLKDMVIDSEYFTRREQIIIYLRVQGFEDPEIAAALHLTKQRIEQIRKGCRERLERLTGYSSR